MFSTCIHGLRQLQRNARTTPDRQATCACLKQASINLGVIWSKAASLPGICRLYVPYKISRKIDCSREVKYQRREISSMHSAYCLHHMECVLRVTVICRLRTIQDLLSFFYLIIKGDAQKKSIPRRSTILLYFCCYCCIS